MSSTLKPTAAPFIPVAPIGYDSRYQDQFSNVLRLYFVQLDNFLQSLLQNSGARFLNFPHLFASDGDTQYADGDSTPTIVGWTTVVRAEGFTLDTGTGAAISLYSGAFRLDYRLQVENSDAAPHIIYVWMRINGEDVANSCTKFTIPASTGVDSYVVCESFIEAELRGGSTIQLLWATDKAATSGGGLGVYLEAYPAQVSPFPAPAIPSAYGSITFVSELSQ